MKALTIRQPWASLIILGIKTIETRSWRLPASMVGQRIAIHAGAHKLTRWEIDEINDLWDVDDAPVAIDDGALWWRGDAVTAGHAKWSADLIHRSPMPLGAVIGYATLGEDLPIVDIATPGHREVVGRMIETYEAIDGTRVLLDWPNGAASPSDSETDITDQLPYGDYTPGRHGWLLTDLEPCDPIPAKGRLGFWDWEAA